MQVEEEVVTCHRDGTCLGDFEKSETDAVLKQHGPLLLTWFDLDYGINNYQHPLLYGSGHETPAVLVPGFVT